jgi:hypothetical protein
MSRAEPPEFAWLATKRDGRLMPVADRFLLVRLWTFTDHLDKRIEAGRRAGLDGPEPAFACPAIGTVKDEIGCGERTLYQQIERLRDAGWLRRARRRIRGRDILGWELAENEAGRYCNETQVSLPKTTAEPAAMSNAQAQPDMNPTAGGRAMARSQPRSGSHQTQLTTVSNSKNADVVDISAQRRKAERERVEADVRQALIDARVVIDVSITYMAPIVERVLEGEATMADVLVVLVEWKRRRAAGDDQAPVAAPALFYAGACWYKTQRDYLGRALSQRGRAPSSAMAGNAAKWEAIKAEPPPELDEEFLALPDRVGAGGDT